MSDVQLPIFLMLFMGPGGQKFFQKLWFWHKFIPTNIAGLLFYTHPFKQTISSSFEVQFWVRQVNLTVAGNPAAAKIVSPPANIFIWGCFQNQFVTYTSCNAYTIKSD